MGSGLLTPCSWCGDVDADHGAIKCRAAMIRWMEAAERERDEARAEVERLRGVLVAVEDDAEGFADVAWDAARATSEVRERDDVRAEEAAATARILAARIIGMIHAAGEPAKDGG
jgi:hypothetical protein